MTQNLVVPRKSPMDPNTTAYIDKTLKYIAENFMKDITVNEIAAYAALCRGYFTRIFQRAYGISPKQYIIRYRIEQGCKLLLGTNSKISDIANQCGFRSDSNFSATFKRLKGCTPQEYRSKK